MAKFSPVLLLLIFLLLFSIKSRGQGHADQPIHVIPCFLHAHLDDDDDLPQNSVMALYRDTVTGFLWIATQGGLARYDGHSLVNYNSVDDQYSKRFVSIFRTLNKDVFFLTSDGLYFLLKNDGIKMVTDNKLQQAIFPFVYFRSGVCDTGQLWKIGYRGTISGHEEWLREPYQIIPVNKNSFWTLGIKKVMLYENDRIKKTIPFDAVKDYRLVGYKGKVYLINNMLEGFRVDDRQGVLVPLQKDQRIRVPERAAKRERPYLSPFYDYANDQLNYWHKDTFFRLTIDKDRLSASAAYYLPGLPDDVVVSVVDAKKNIIVAGSLSKGVYLYKAQYFQQVLTESIQDKSIYAQVLVDDNRLLTNQSVIFNLAQGRVEQSFPEVPMKQVRAFSKDKKGHTLFCAVDQFYEYRPDTRSIHKILPYLVGDVTFTYYDTIRERFWIVSPNKSGYFRNNIFHEVTWHSETKKAPMITYIDEPKGEPLTVTTVDGIWYFSEAKDGWYPYDSTLGKTYRYLAVLDKSLTLVTGYGIGYAIWDREHQKMTPMPIDEKGYLKFVHNLIPDNKGYLWATTNKGLFRYRISDIKEYARNMSGNLYYEYFDKKDGLWTNEFNGAQYPSFNWWNNNLLLSTIDGIMKFVPEQIPEYYFPEPVYIEALHIPGKRSIEVLRREDTIYRLEPNERNIKIHISTAAWYNTYGMLIEYRLDKEPWRKVNVRSMEVELTDLYKGNHVLEVRKKTGFGKDNYVYSRLNFHVGRKYYEHPFFAIGIILGGLLLFILFSKLRQLRLLKQNRLLSHMVQKKTEELQLSNSELQRSLGKVEKSQHFRLRLVSMLLHDIAIPLSSVEKISEILFKHHDKLDKDTWLEGTGKINFTVRELQALSHQLIDWAQIHQFSGEPVMTTFSLGKLMEEVNSIVAQHIFNVKSNVYTHEYDPEQVITSDPTIIKHIVLNVLFNANKYTEMGSIMLRVVPGRGDNLRIIVKDTGKGMHPGTVDKLNAYTAITNEEIKSGTALEMGWGLGYQIIFDLLSILNGSLHVQSSPGNGTAIELNIPLKDAHPD
jgi:signal transduction histidine kinase/ligand-binding sensor domain-containing protein